MNEPRFWSDRMNILYREQIQQPVFNDSYTDFSEDTLLGVPFQTIRDEVIVKGRANFSTEYKYSDSVTLTADQKVLLYCFINFKKHFYACVESFHQNRDSLSRWHSLKSPYLIDLGCGPATAGLAMCDCIPGVKWNYLGIDTAVSMRTMANQLLTAAKSSGLLLPDSDVSFFPAWTAPASNQLPRDSALLLVCSYFFASASINTSVLRSLATWVKSLVDEPGRTVVLFAYLNSTNPWSNTNYEYFKTLLGLDPLAHSPTQTEVVFRKKQSSSVLGSDTFLHELITLKGD